MRTIIVFIIAILIPEIANSAVIFSDNFDGAGDTGWTCADSVRTGYTGASTCPASDTYNSVTHYAGEISSGGRSGNSFKQWRRNGTPWDVQSLYLGYLDKFLTSDEFNNNYKELYVRFYMKVPTAWDATLGGGQTHKLNRYYYGTTQGSVDNEMLLDVKGSTFKTGNLSLYITGGLGYVWKSQQTVTQLGLCDGEWHALEVRTKINSTTGGFKVWIDGTAITMCDGIGENCAQDHANIDTGGASDYFTKLLSPGIGNLTDGTFNNSTADWYAIEFDDYVSSTTYIGLDEETPAATAVLTGGNCPGCIITH